MSLNPNYLDKFNVELMKKLCKFNDDIYIGTTRAIASKLKDEGYEIINSLTGEVFVTDDNESKIYEFKCEGTILD